MRIAIVTDYFYPTLGGISEHVYGQALSLVDRGHEVTVVTGHVPRPPLTIDRDPQREEPDAFDVVRMGRTFPLYGNGSQTLHTFSPLIHRALKRLFEERCFDIIHTHAPYNLSFVQLVPYVAPRESTVVGTFHSVFSRTLLGNIFTPFLRPSIARLDGRIVVSAPCIDSLRPYFPFDYTVIPNGIDESRFTCGAEPLPELRDGRLNILFVGRFDPRNGLGTMIKAFAAVRRAMGPTVRLVIVGDGPLHAYYARSVPDDVAADIVWAGRINWTRPRYYASADVLCTPCDRASFGMVLLEAMSCGVPVVASRISGFQLLMEDGRQGLMVENARDADAFAHALLRLLSAPGQRACMGREGRRTAIEHYSWSRVAARLEDYYRETIASNRA